MPRGKKSFDEYAFKESTTSTTAFPILRTNSYGRMMIGAQMNTHDRLIRNARSRTDSYLSKVRQCRSRNAVASPSYLTGR